MKETAPSEQLLFAVVAIEPAANKYSVSPSELSMRLERQGMIEGGIADDRVIDTVEGYINGDFPADVAIGRLIHHKPNNQTAILSQEILDRHLKWIKAETLSEDTE